MYKLVIFDMDGTILDTLEDIKESVNYALSTMGYPTRTLDEVRGFVGNGIPKLIERALPSDAGPEIQAQTLQRFMEHYAVHSMDHTGPYAGVPELVARLKEQGIQCAVNTNKADVAAHKLADRFFKDQFEFVLGAQEGLPGKPDPAGVERILEKLQVKKCDVIYIGDSNVDYQTACNAGVDYIMVTWGFRTRTQLEEAGATVIVDDCDSVYQHIMN